MNKCFEIYKITTNAHYHPKLTSFHIHFTGFLSFLFYPQGVQNVSFEPSPLPQTRQDVRVPSQLGSASITPQAAQPPGMPLLGGPRGDSWAAVGKCRSGGLACTQVAAWLTSPPPSRAFITTVMVYSSFASWRIMFIFHHYY